MLRGLYTAASGMLAHTISTDTLANNLANVSTVGFKSNKVNFESFPEMLMNRLDQQGRQALGGMHMGSQVRESVINFTPGGMRQTGNDFDMAIEGDAFFTVQSPAGQTYYTRAGNFKVNQDGFLTTATGDYVMGSLGRIQLNLDQGPFSISEFGNISASGRQIDQLKMARFTDNNSLEKVGDTYYQATINSQFVDPAPQGVPMGYKVQQYMLEHSNVNPVGELVNNIQGMRLYEALQKNIRMSNDTLGKAVNEVGRVR